MRSNAIPDQAAPKPEVKKPVVALVFEQAKTSNWQDLVTSLNVPFTCSAHVLTSTSVTQPLGNAELVIWQHADTEKCLGPGFLMALASVLSTCPVILIADNLDDIALDLPFRHLADFLIRPYTHQELILRSRRALGSTAPIGLVEEGPAIGNINSIVVGGSSVLAKEVNKLKRFAACDAGVLILGETGTGKEVFARSIHYVSARAAKPMVAINCGAVPAELVESELFGHVKGAYTNAYMARTGLVREAQGGTLLLDDVDCLPLSAQAKLLRFLQEHEYRVVGSNAVQHADVRVIAASNRDLAAMARQGTFRQDLFYRLNVLTLSLPPLREHKEDIGALAQHFLRQFAQLYKRPACSLSSGALLKLLSYDWPGNVRELGHVLERAVLLSQTSSLVASDFDLPVAMQDEVRTEAFQAMKARVVQSFERSYIEGVLSSTNGNIAEAARISGKNRRALFELIRKHEICPASFRAATNA
jgi:two-component system, NtrC family, response regulator GlrR